MILRQAASCYLSAIANRTELLPCTKLGVYSRRSYQKTVRTLSADYWEGPHICPSQGPPHVQVPLLMDPASATGLAAAILQLATFGTKVLLTTRELHSSSSGALNRYAELSLVAKNLQNILQRCRYERVSGQDGKDGPEKESQLNALAVQAEVIIKELLALLDRLKLETNARSSWTTIRSAFLTVIKEGDLKELERRLERLRSSINDAVLHDLRQVITHTATHALADIIF